MLAKASFVVVGEEPLLYPRRGQHTAFRQYGLLVLSDLNMVPGRPGGVINVGWTGYQNATTFQNGIVIPCLHVLCVEKPTIGSIRLGIRNVAGGAERHFIRTRKQHAQLTWLFAQREIDASSH